MRTAIWFIPALLLVLGLAAWVPGSVLDRPIAGATAALFADPNLAGVLVVLGLGATPGPDGAPLVRELRRMLRSLYMPRALTETIRVDWTPDSLRGVLRQELPDAEVVVVSNREPYIHNLKDGQVTLQRPASGLVTALEPVMRACGGMWIAHGSGSADQAVVDAGDHLPVPPLAGVYPAPHLAVRRGAGRLLLRLRQ